MDSSLIRLMKWKTIFLFDVAAESVSE